jgi:hypothetical protein
MRKHKSLDDIKQNIHQDIHVINLFYSRIKGMKHLCIKEYDRQIFLSKITKWLLYSVSPAIGGIIISKRNSFGYTINIIISLILFLVPICQYLLSLYEHDKHAITLQIYISKIDSIMQLIEYNKTITLDNNSNFFVFINKQANELESFKPYISEHTIHKYLREVSSSIQKDHIPRICNEYLHKYKFAEENDIETNILFELSSVNYKNNSFNIPKYSIPESDIHKTQQIDIYDTFTRNSSFGSEENNTQTKHSSKESNSPHNINNHYTSPSIFTPQTSNPTRVSNIITNNKIITKLRGLQTIQNM